MAVLDFFTSPIGLGHATRDAAIAAHLQDMSLRFVSGSAASRFLNRAGFEVSDRYCPPRFHVRDGTLRNRARWLYQYYGYYRDSRNAAGEIILEDSPDIVVSDEDFASLSVAQQKKVPTVLITDILETRFTGWPASVVEKRMNRSMKSIIDRCDAVIMPEHGPRRGNITRVGPIVRHTAASRDALRRRFSFRNKTVLVSVGGTDAGSFLMERVLEAAPRIAHDADIVAVSGPSLEKRHALQVKDMGFVNNMHELIFASDVLVSLAGRSSIDEAAAYGTPGIFIPIRGHFEQEDNAKRQGFAFDDLDSMEDLIMERLEWKRGAVSAGNGAAAAARVIRGLL